MLEALTDSRWDFATAAHLLNRAGFGGTPAEIEELAALSPVKAVERLVEYTPVQDDQPDADWARPDPGQGGLAARMKTATPDERRQIQAQRRRAVQRQTAEMQHWWVDRMTRSKTPLHEKLTLFWHGHFATSVVKVGQPHLMWRQNLLFRQHGRGSWLTLLQEITKDPAMLIWLDQAQSKATHPNENFARELMELFTLGEGNYTERDVTEAARALTGLTLDRAHWEPIFRKNLHDDGEKTVLGKTGHLTGGDVVERVAQAPASARFITARLWLFFAGSLPSAELNQALADHFERNGRQFLPLLKTMFRAEEFYAPTVLQQQIKSPVQLMVMACRQLDRNLPPAPIPTNALRLLGQELFAPPSVKGWDGGSTWINTNTLLTRHNLALLLVEGQNVLPIAATRPGIKERMEKAIEKVTTPPADPNRVMREEDRRSTPALLWALERRFFQHPLTARSSDALKDYIRSKSRLREAELLGIIRLAMCTPEYQLT